MAGLHLLDHADDRRRVPVRGVDEDHVDPRGDECADALVGIAGHADRGADPNARGLRGADLCGLVGDGEVAMEDAEPAQQSERDRHRRLGDRIHRGGEDRDVQGDLASDDGTGRDLAGEDVAAGRDEEHVVEGEALGAELLLPVHAALTRSIVPRDAEVSGRCYP